MSDQNISTYLRIKPTKNPSGYYKVDDLENSRITVDLPEAFKSDYVDNTKLHHGFSFNGVLNMNVTQDDVFKLIGVPAVQNAFAGFNSSIFVYGQTGSGKTFTLTGGAERYADRGIIPRSISMIYNEIRNRIDAQIKVSISYFEIYNEQGHDLLATDDGRTLEKLPKVKVLEDEYGGFHLKNLSVHAADTEEEALNLLFLGDTNRAVAETPMNLASSRSHCIFLISLETREHGSDKVRRSKLNLIDLAGSERIGKTNSSGTILREANAINSSLFYLEVVITALHERATVGRTHIPYRNSLMTSVLRDSLGGNCKTTMIATMSPEASHTDESLSTCRFAQRVSQVKNKVSINEELDPSLMIKRLKSEILTLREEISFLKGENDDENMEMSSLMIEELKKKIREYCDDRDMSKTLNIGKLTLSNIKTSFTIFKSYVLQAESAVSSSSSSSGPSDDNNKLALTTKSNNGNGSSSSGGATQQQGSKEQNKIITDLRECLLQREHEIAILVNMVKQGKTVDDVASVTLRGGINSNNTTLDDESFRKRNNNEKESFDNNGRRSIGSRGNEDNNGSRGGNQENNNDTSHEARARERQRLFEVEEKRRKQREAEKEEKILKTLLFGVPPPPTQAIFNDSAASFDWFQERCSMKKAIDENMEALKDAIQDAKTNGEKANKSRSTINYLKSSIEAIRRERALEKVSDQNHSYDESKHQDEQDEEEDAESEEELTLRRQIDKEKFIYKESFERLRELKPQIEHIKRTIEKCRATMMKQYDQWYSYLHSKPIVTNPDTNPSQQSLSQSQQQLQPSFSQQQQQYASTGNSNYPDSKHSNYSSQQTTAETYSKSSASSSSVVSSNVSDLGSASVSEWRDSSSTRRGRGPSTGVREEVDEDIEAFYKAKDQLVCMQKSQQQHQEYKR